MSTTHCSLLSLGCIFGFVFSTPQTSLSALRALRIGQRRLRPEVRSKLLSVSSARTDSSLAPQAWRFVFLDPGTTDKSRMVTVAAKTSSEHPETVEAFGSAQTVPVASLHVIAQNKLLLDSDRVLAQARTASKLKGVRAAEYRLAQPGSGQEPLWTLYLYGGAPEPVARFQVGAKTGAVKILGPE